MSRFRFHNPALLLGALLSLPAASLAVVSQEGNPERLVYDRMEREGRNAPETPEQALQRQKEAAAEAERIRSLPVRDILKIPPSEAALAAEEEGEEADGDTGNGDAKPPQDEAGRYLLIGLGATLLLSVAGLLLAGGRKTPRRG